MSGRLMCGRLMIGLGQTLTRLGVLLITAGSVQASQQAVRAADEAIGLHPDPVPSEVTGELRPGSHVKLFIPNLPYLAISHAINGALLRPANNKRGWKYDLAVSHFSIDDRIWEFRLREDARFQDGTPFNADSVIENMAYFVKAPFTFTKLSSILDRVEKVDDYRVRFYLTEPYGVFPHDAVWLQFYTRPYLEKFGWNGKPTCPNLAEPGPYALGPYELVEGYVEGDRSSPKVVLKANKDYWGEDKAKVETITIYTSLSLDEARDLVEKEEGKLDLTPVAFGDQVDAVLSPYSKLAVSSSLNNYAMHFNMLNGNPALQDERIRFVINRAIDQDYLLNLSMLGEGDASPTMVSPNFYKVDEALALLQDYFDEENQAWGSSPEALREIVRTYQKEQGRDPQEPLKITVLAQESFLFLIRDIQYFLSRVNIELEAKILPKEKDVFLELFATWKDSNGHPWDLLLWGNYDWYKHPWAAFFVYRPFNDWSTIPPNAELEQLTDQMVSANVESAHYPALLARFIRHVHEHNYMVFLPTPNNVYAVNKEVMFNPGRSAFVYLRDLEVTDQHWSLRGDAVYPETRQRPIRINRVDPGRYEMDESEQVSAP